MTARPDPATASPTATVLTSRVGRAQAGLRLLDYLAQRFRYLPRAAWQQEIAAGRVAVDGQRSRADRLLGTGSLVAWQRSLAEPVVDTAIESLAQGSDFLVVAKPAHLPVHADGPFVRNTLVHLLRERHGPHVQLVHRLDRETSGVLVVATTKAASERLSPLFATGAAKKTYLAVVAGSLPAAIDCERPIGRAGDSTIALRRSAASSAIAPQAAHTRFEVLASHAGHQLVRCLPTTGRTHQIRVHLEAEGAPLLGDKLYGRPDADYLTFVARVKAGGDARQVPPGQPDRQLLHAHELTLPVVAGQPAKTFRAPLPADFVAWCARLGLSTAGV